MAVSCVRVKSDGIIDWEKPNADFQRMVKLAHLVFSKRTKLIPQSAFIDGAKLLQQDDRVAVKTWDWSIQVHMSRKFMHSYLKLKNVFDFHYIDKSGP